MLNKILNKAKQIVNDATRALSWDDVQDADNPGERAFLGTGEGCTYVVSRVSAGDKGWGWTKMSPDEWPIDLRVGFQTAREAQEHAEEHYRCSGG